MIYFVSYSVRDLIHAQALGFTKNFYGYVWATNEELAKQEAAKYIKKAMPTNELLNASVTVAQQQDPMRYAFPENIKGLPASVLANAERRWSSLRSR
ncbi:hypothetical protein [Methylobacillus sp.]|uniref:hypothetical protein n=1 Tax=Methylobacillus sp. TaxID=56818 RepID=UPI0012C635E3|nr:hypothetical protein [Methylobacillus sp.]MPS48509.1 hypothetical protein [Methylobacillus sp.]